MFSRFPTQRDLQVIVETALAMSIAVTNNSRGPNEAHHTPQSHQLVRIDADQWWRRPDSDPNDKSLHESPLLSHVRKSLGDVAKAVDLSSGDIPPTALAAEAVMKLLAESEFWHAIPLNRARPRVITVGDGDLIVEWRTVQGEVVLFALDDGSTRLHCVTRANGQIVKQDVLPSPTAGILVDALKMLS